MSDSFTETTRVSWFGRIKRSVGAVVIGLVLIVAMIVLLFWNEGRAVTTARSLDEGAAAVVSVDAGSMDAAHEGKLIHVTGPVTTNSTPSDPSFGIEAKGIRLVRNVEMYQWKEESRSETTKQLGGGEETVTTYTYSKVWDDRPINSGNFKKPEGHTNPSMEIRGDSFQVPEAKLGAFTLDKPVLDLMSNAEALPIRADQASAIRAAFSGSKPLRIVDGRIYLGYNANSPQVGDYRIAYEVVPVGTVSIVGQQSGSGLAGYQTVAGDELLMVDAGSVSADKMFEEAKTANTMLTWILRVVGLLLLFVGFAMLLSWMGVLADVIPFVGSIVGFGTGLIAFVMAILVGSGVIAFAWFWYRPLLALAIFGGGALVAFLLTRMRGSKPALAGAPAGAPPPASSPKFGRAADPSTAPSAREQAPAPEAPKPAQGGPGKINW